MVATKRLQLIRFLVMGLTFFVLCGLFQPTVVIGASLTIWTDDGQQHAHDLAIVESINYNDEQFQVVTVYSTHQYALESINKIDFADYPTGTEDPEDMADIIKVVHLFQNYPNPFNPTTQIDFEIPVRGMVKLCIYSVKGQLIRSLIERDMEAGPQSVRWDGCDDAGNSVASGVYFYSLATSGLQESRKMILLR